MNYVLMEFKKEFKKLLSEKQHFLAFMLSEAYVNFYLNLYVTTFFMKDKDWTEKAQIYHKYTLYNKIKQAYLLGIIDKELYSKLDSFRNTRNKFVHKFFISESIMKKMAKSKPFSDKWISQRTEESEKIVETFIKKYYDLIAKENGI